MRDLFILLGFCLLIVLNAVVQGSEESGVLLPEAKGVAMSIEKKPTVDSYFVTYKANEKSVPYFYKTSRNLLFLFLILFFIFSYMFVVEYFRQNQNENVDKDKLRLYQDLELKTRQGLQEKIAEKNRQLAVVTVALEEKNKMLSGISLRLNNLKSKSFDTIRNDLTPITYTIERNLNVKDDWMQFQQHFSKLHPGFFNRLKKEYPHLRPNDLRICAYQKMNFTTPEIANLLHINQSSVQKARYRLKKKLSLDTKQSLDSFLSTR